MKVDLLKLKGNILFQGYLELLCHYVLCHKTSFFTNFTTTKGMDGQTFTPM